MSRLPLYLQGVKWNAFDQSRGIIFSGKIGKIYPVEFYLLNFGDPICTKNNHLLRFAPMLSPIMSEFRFDVDTFVVPLRVLYPDGIDKFNLATNPNGWNLPTMPIAQRFNSSRGINEMALLDFFDMGLRRSELLEVIGTTYVSSSGTTKYDPWEWTKEQTKIATVGYYKYGANFYAIPDGNGDYEYNGNYTFLAYTYSLGSMRWLNPIDGVTLDDFRSWFDKHPTMDSFLNEVGLNTNSWYDIVMDFISGQIGRFGTDPNSMYGEFTEAFYSGLSVPDYLIRAYNKIYIDYYAQTQVIDPDTFESQNVLNPGSFNNCNLDVLPRFYGDDYFTQCYANSQVGDAVEIPADGTIVDLANATALQRLRIRLNYTGKRIKDFAKNIFDVNVPDARLDRSEFLNRVTYKIQVSDVAQTSETTSQSELAGFSGRGISWGKDIKTRWTASEPCVVMVLASVRPDSWYSLGLDPYHLIRNTMDFPVPDMENVGNHPVSKALLSGKYSDMSTVFGWNRPYYPFLNRSINRVCGNMRTLYSYWNTYRDVSNMVYNKDWLSVQDDESVNRIFTVKNVDQFYCHMNFYTSIGRPLSKTVKFEV